MTTKLTVEHATSVIKVAYLAS